VLAAACPHHQDVHLDNLKAKYATLKMEIDEVLAI
jgi:hypothetical protein